MPRPESALKPRSWEYNCSVASSGDSEVEVYDVAASARKVHHGNTRLLYYMNMDLAAAYAVIAEQDQIVRARIRQRLAELSRQGQVHADAVAPWRGRAWTGAPWVLARSYFSMGSLGPFGRVKDDAVQPLKDARTWYDHADAELGRLREVFSCVAAADQRFEGMEAEEQEAHLSFASDSFAYGQVPEYRKEYLNRAVRALHERLLHFSSTLEARLVDKPALVVPKEIHPPRYGKVGNGVLSRLLIEDLEAVLAEGQALATWLAEGSSQRAALKHWREHVSADLLSKLSPDVSSAFSGILKYADRYSHDFVADKDRLAAAYLAISLNYLEEVRDRIEVYAEASGQVKAAPSISMVVNGGVVYSAQVAAEINNTNASIAKISRQWNGEVADALKALQGATLSEDIFSDEQRKEILEYIDFLAKAAQAEPEKRASSVVRSVLKALGVAAAGGTELEHALAAWDQVLNQLAR